MNMSSDNNEHALHSDSSPPTTLSSKIKGKKKTAHHHAHHLHSPHKKHRSSADMALSPSTLKTSPVCESNMVSIDDVPASSTKETKGHHHHKHHHASHRKKHGTPEDANIVASKELQATSQVETHVVTEDQIPAAAAHYDVESPPPIGTTCMAANKDTSKAIEQSQDKAPTKNIVSPRKLHDAPIAMATEKVQPIQSPHEKESNCMANTSIILGTISLFFVGLLFGVLAIIFAIVAFHQIKREPHRFTAVSTCRATQGLFVGCIGVFISVIILLAFTL